MRFGKHCPRYGANVQLLTPYSKAGSWPSLFMLLKPLPSPNITSLPALIPSQEAPQDGCLASPSPGADRGAQRWHRPRHRACDYRNCRPSYWCKRLQGRERTVDHRNSSHCPLLQEVVESSTCGQLSSFQIRQEFLLLGNEKGAALPFLL